MQTCGRLVQDVQSAACIAFGQFQGQFHPLGFTARQGGGALAQAHIAQAHVHQGLQLARQSRHGFKEVVGFAHGHVQHFADVFAFVLHFQGFAVVALAVTHFARHVHIGQEVHFHFQHAIALASLAAAAFDVEREAAHAVTPFARQRHARIQFAYRRENACVSGRVGARSAANRALVDIDDFVELLHAFDVGIRRWLVFGGTVQIAGGDFGQGVVNQGRFAAA